MRILVVNVNTTVPMTEAIASSARAVAGPDTEIVPVTPAIGADSVEGNFESYLAAVAVMDAVTRYPEPFDAVVQAGFADLVHDGRLDPTDDFAVVPTTTLDFTSLVPADAGSDEVLEGFDFGGADPASLEDTQAVLDAPAAEWGGGRLSSAFHEGTGGPNGDFDWIVRRGENFFFDTTSTPIVGGPGGVPTATLQLSTVLCTPVMLLVSAL